MAKNRLWLFALMGILFLVGAAFLTSCKASEEPTGEATSVSAEKPAEEPTAEEPAEPEPVSLAIGTHLTREEWNVMFTEDFLAVYMEENPNVTVEHQPIAFGEFAARIATDRLADEPPDIYLLPAWWLGNLVDTGVILPVPEDIADDVHSNFTPGAIEAVTWESIVYGVPMDNNPTNLIYKNTALEEAGYTEPPKTFEEMMDMARNLTKKDEEGNVVQYGYSQFVGSLNWNYLPFVSQLYSCGGNVFDPETGLSAFNGPEGVYILENWVKLIEEGHFNPEVTSQEWSESDRVAMVLLPNWTRFYITLYNDLTTFSSAKVPPCEGYESGAIVYNWFAVVNSKSDNIEAAWDWVRWWTQPSEEGTQTPMAEFYFNQASIIPPRYSDLEAMEDLLSTDLFPAYVQSLEYARGPTPVAEYEEIIGIIIAELESAFFSIKTPQEALDDAAAQVDALLQAP